MSQRHKITPAEFIDILKAASAEQLVEIRQLLGLPTVWTQPMPYPVVTPAPEPTPRPAPYPPFAPWSTCQGTQLTARDTPVIRY